MNPSEKCVMLAAECERMAELTCTPESKCVWIRMAERWLQCARLYDREASVAHLTSLSGILPVSYGAGFSQR
jgi:hypothetical protein